MKKSILLAIAILMMTFGITTNVYASVIPITVTYDLTLANNSGWSKSGRNYIKDINSSSYGWQDNFIELPQTLKTNINTYDYTYVNASLLYTIGTNTLILNNVDFDTTCTQSHLENMVPDLQITYADGTHADIDGSTYEQICDSYHIAHYNNNITITETNRDKSPYFNLLVRKNGQNITCEPLGQSLYKCPKYNIEDINGSQYFIFNTYFNGSGGNYKIYLYEYLYFENKDSTDIINNQNQNTTTISNNITNLNDNILDSNLNSSTSSNASNIGANDIDSSSKNVILDFMLMPITFIQNLLNSFDNTCATLCIGNCGSGHDNEWRFVFPCIDLQSILGSTVYNLIDLLMTFGMVFAFVRSVVGFLKKALLLENDISSEVRIF